MQNHPKWKGGISERPYKVRKTIERLLKESKECKDCKSKEALQGHHIIPYSTNPKLGCDVNNIEILCVYCHAKRHPDLKEFILKGIKYEAKEAMD